MRLIVQLVFLILYILPTSASRAADLDQLYTPLLTPGQWLYTLRSDITYVWDKGFHGSASFDFFHANPRITSLLNALRFSPVTNWDIQLGYQHVFPLGNWRSTTNMANQVTSYQKYFIDIDQDFTLDLRHRQEGAEYYFNVFEKRSKSQWNFAQSLTAAPIFFNYFNSHYEDIKFGARFLTGGNGPGQNSLFDRPLLDAGQWNSEWEFGYKNGRLDREGWFYIADRLQRFYYTRTKPHFLPRVDLRYGLTSYAELEAGLIYTTPIKFLFDYNQYKNSGLKSYTSGTYTMDHNFDLPLKVRYRPSVNIEWMVGLKYHYLKQDLHSWDKAENGTVTLFPEKELDYYNIIPQLEFNYLTTPDHQKLIRPIEQLTSTLLAQRQTGFVFSVFKDWTILKKNGTNATQNILDPYNLYLYPAENFVAGTEHAAFFSGNNAASPANLRPQNYMEYAIGLRAGLTDQWEIGLKTGYRSATSGHQYSLGDRSNRFFVFKEYYYIDLKTDWDITQSSRLSLRVHFVPDYRTILDTSNNPEQFKDHTRYVETSVVFKILF